MIALAGAAAAQRRSTSSFSAASSGTASIDEVDAGDGGLHVGRRLDARRAIRRVWREQARLHVAAGALEQPLAGGPGQVGRGVDQRDANPGPGQMTGDAAAHGPAAEHGDRLDALDSPLRHGSSLPGVTGQERPPRPPPAAASACAARPRSAGSRRPRRR